MLAFKFNMLSSWNTFLTTGNPVVVNHVGCVPPEPTYTLFVMPADTAYGQFAEISEGAYTTFTVPAEPVFSTGC